jgi:hypothetical protein
MLLTAILLVALPLVVFAVASTQRQMPLPVAQALHHHYFEVGYRQCESAIKKAEAQSTGDQLLVAVALTSSDFPTEFRKDVSAGCQAAQ